jgi:ribosomal protein RSM22 (predicted rRNA methylase)
MRNPRAGVAQLAERQPSKLHVASSNLVSRSTPSTASAGPALSATAARLRSALERTIRVDARVAAASEALSEAYRSGTPASQAGHVRDPLTAAAYAAARMPATFAALGRALAEAARTAPAFAPVTLLDIGAGTGAATWAAGAIWPSLASLTLVDREPAMVELGRRLATRGGDPLTCATWRVADLATTDLSTADVVTAGYVLGELDEASAGGLVDRAWTATTGILAIIEPGSRAGFGRILAARDRLIRVGAAIIAPCPGNDACPVRDPEWCHFLARLDRSPLQRRAKGASRSWEDEPFSYVVASRVPADPAPRVVLGRPRQRPGMVELRICVDGRIDQRTLSRRDGPAYRMARDLAWGDRVPDEVLEAGG